MNNYYKSFKKFIKISVLLNEFYSKDSSIEYIEVYQRLSRFAVIIRRTLWTDQAIKNKNSDLSKKHRKFSIK